MSRKTKTIARVTSDSGKATIGASTAAGSCGIYFALVEITFVQKTVHGESISFPNAFAGKEGIIIGDSIVGCVAPGGKLWCTSIREKQAGSSVTCQVIMFD